MNILKTLFKSISFTSAGPWSENPSPGWKLYRKTESVPNYLFFSVKFLSEATNENLELRFLVSVHLLVRQVSPECVLHCSSQRQKIMCPNGPKKTYLVDPCCHTDRRCLKMGFIFLQISAFCVNIAIFRLCTIKAILTNVESDESSKLMTLKFRFQVGSSETPVSSP